MQRNEDLTKVFDRTWKANHNDDVKVARANEKRFWNKMFNVKEDTSSKRGVITPGEQVSNLQRNINSANDFQNRNRVNNIVKKWK